MSEYVVVDKEKLENDLTIVADSIRAKANVTEKIEFPSEYKSVVESIDTSKPEQEKTIEITENGTTEVTPDEGKVLSKVAVNVEVKGSSNGESINLLDYASFYSGRVFFGAKFPDNTDIKIKTNHANPSLVQQLNYTNVKSITIDFSSATSIDFGFAFNGSTHCTDITLIGDFRKVSNCNSMFNDSVKLENINGIIDLTNAKNTMNMFNKCHLLKEVRFLEGTIKTSFEFLECLSLSDESIQSIIDGLADLTSATTQTLTLYTTVKAKLTETQIATITGKNWNLA